MLNSFAGAAFVLCALLLQGCKKNVDDTVTGNAATKNSTTRRTTTSMTSTRTTTSMTSTRTTTSMTRTSTSTKTTTTAGGGPHCLQSHGTLCTQCKSPFKLVGGRCFYTCDSDLNLGPLVRAESKGLALDDSTLHYCPDQLLNMWPNTDAPVKSMRIFKAWESDWEWEWKEQAWRNIAHYVHNNNVKIMIGTLISCDEQADDRDWADILQLLELVGNDYVMGVAIGNEPELFWLFQAPECANRMFRGGYLWRKFQDRIKALDCMPGFQEVKVTTVFGEFALGQGTWDQPFVEDPNRAMVSTFIRNAFKAYGSRFTLTVNIYTYFDINNHMDPGSPHTCDQALAKNMCFDSAQYCVFAQVVKAFRERMSMISPDFNTLWIGETGWSLPVAKTLKTDMKYCPAWASEQTFETYYRNFIKWDMTIPGVKGPDHVFYFTMRDSVVNGLPEGFGLISNIGGTKLCQVSQCKLQASGRAVALRELLQKVPVNESSVGQLSSMQFLQRRPDAHAVSTVQ